MKFLVTSDWHIGSQKFPSPKLREERSLDALRKFVDWINDSDYDEIWFAGDFFDVPKPNLELLNKVMCVLESCKKPMKFIKGNNFHETDDVLTILQWVNHRNVEYLKFDGYYQCDTDNWSIIWISHKNNAKEWLESFKKQYSKIHMNKRETIYVICHQWFDCFVDFGTKEIVKVEELEKLLSQYPDNKFNIISGHLHKQQSYIGTGDKTYTQNFSITSIGIPIQQDFKETYDFRSSAIEIDTDLADYWWIILKICDSKFKKIKSFHPDFFDYNKQHFYQLDITDEQSEQWYKKLVDEGFHVQPNRIPQEGIPDKLDREQQKKDFSPKETIEKTVEELTGEPNEALVKKGMELITTKILF